MMFSKVIESLAVMLSEYPFSFSQIAALHIMDDAAHLNIQELALRLNLSLSATSRLVDDLVKQGLIERTEDKDNRRSKLVTLTNEGKKFLDRLSLERVKIIKETADSLPKILSQKLLSALALNKD